MTLKEISEDYGRSAQAIRKRIRTLRQLERKAATPAERERLSRRRMELVPLLRECSRLEKQTQEYYYEGSEDHGDHAG